MTIRLDTGEKSIIKLEGEPKIKYSEAEIHVKNHERYEIMQINKLVCLDFIDAISKHEILHSEIMNLIRVQARQHKFLFIFNLLPTFHKFHGDGVEVYQGRCYMCTEFVSQLRNP